MKIFHLKEHFKQFKTASKVRKYIHTLNTKRHIPELYRQSLY